MSGRDTRYFMCDFETTVYKGQQNTEVWASACVELFTENVRITNNLPDLLEYFKSLHCNIIAYFHNLKFDGEFIISYLIKDLKYNQAYVKLSDEPYRVKWLPKKDMQSKTFSYSISNRGQWYNITIKIGRYYIEIRDSLKLLPFSVKRIGESFGTKHKKLDMEYKGFRYAGGEIKEDEKRYIANDVLVPKEALEIMVTQGHDKTTIGSCCLSEFKKGYDRQDYKLFFPDIYEYTLDEKIHTYSNAGEWTRKAYKGGWCYLVKGKENKLYGNGLTCDVNSLYPSMMHSESGNRYPVGLPRFWSGNYIPDEALKNNRYYFIRIKTRFYLKEGYLPFIQIKGNFLYKGTECLESSDIYDSEMQKYYTEYIGENGEICDTRVELTLTMTDYLLLKEHYNLIDFEIIDGCYYDSEIGLFDTYIDKYKKIKMVSTGSIRELAKLFLNNLYGKFAMSQDSSFKVAYLKEDDTIGFVPVTEHEKTAGYIPIGAAITSYARNFTIRAAQKNYHGVDKPGFIYADTDSIHCDLLPHEVKGVNIDNVKFCCWKMESRWDSALFVRQKTYMEHIVEKDLNEKDGTWSGKLVETPKWDLKCAGMPPKCKDLFQLSMQGTQENNGEWSEDELAFLFEKDKATPIKRTPNDFKIGLRVPGKLTPKRYPGGIVLVDGFYTMR